MRFFRHFFQTFFQETWRHTPSQTAIRSFSPYTPTPPAASSSRRPSKPSGSESASTTTPWVPVCGWTWSAAGNSPAWTLTNASRPTATATRFAATLPDPGNAVAGTVTSCTRPTGPATFTSPATKPALWRATYYYWTKPACHSRVCPCWPRWTASCSIRRNFTVSGIWRTLCVALALKWSVRRRYSVRRTGSGARISRCVSRRSVRIMWTRRMALEGRVGFKIWTPWRGLWVWAGMWRWFVVGRSTGCRGRWWRGRGPVSLIGGARISYTGKCFVRFLNGLRQHSRSQETSTRVCGQGTTCCTQSA